MKEKVIFSIGNKENSEIVHLPSREKVSIIGTGNFAVALASRLLQHGYGVIFGSRSPNSSYLEKCIGHEYTFSVTTIAEAFKQSDCFVFLAVKAETSVYEFVVEEIKNSTPSFDKQRIIVDVSNQISEEKQYQSNAEILRSILDKKSLNNVSVIKGFNLINAYSMSQDIFEQKGSTQSVAICGDDTKAKQKLIELCNSIGFHGIDVGSLSVANKLEQSNNLCFTEWKWSSLFAILFFLFNWIWVFWHYYIFPKKPATLIEYIKSFTILAHTNKTLGFTSLQLLSFVYLASFVASCYQLKYGTKYHRFPSYLDLWLKARKQIGLWAFLFASIHAVISAITANPAYLKTWFNKVDNKTNNYPKMTLNGEINYLSGILAYFLMILVALSSINSIATSLNWSEWRFVQTKIGISCLVAGTAHAIFMYLNMFLSRYEYNYDAVYLWTRVKLISIYLPALVLILRFLFAYFPPISKRLRNIREGRTTDVTIEKFKKLEKFDTYL